MLKGTTFTQQRPKKEQKTSNKLKGHQQLMEWWIWL